MFPCIIDAKEDRDAETSDIQGAFLQIDDISGNTNVKFYGMIAELLACIDPDIYRKYITTDEKDCKILYAERLKALYGTLDSVLLFWV